MALKPKLSYNVPNNEVVHRVSHEFRSIINESQLKGGPYTVISFSGMRGESTSIVDSKVLLKAIEKAKSKNQSMVAVAHNFTNEARKILESLNVQYFTKHDHYWSDESWAYIRDKY